MENSEIVTSTQKEKDLLNENIASVSNNESITNGDKIDIENMFSVSSVNENETNTIDAHNDGSTEMQCNEKDIVCEIEPLDTSSNEQNENANEQGSTSLKDVIDLDDTNGNTL